MTRPLDGAAFAQVAPLVCDCTVFALFGAFVGLRARIAPLAGGRYHAALSLLLDDLDAGVQALREELLRRELARTQPEARA